MKIIEFKAENIKNLKVVEITPTENTVLLTGKNGAGKSAILDSIFMALTGKKARKPIRNGTKKGEIVVNLGDYVVKKVFLEGKDRLEVFSPDGAKYSSPQTLLNGILGKLTFDPLSFANMGITAEGKKKQRDLLMKMVNLDFSETDKQIKVIYEKRTANNQVLKIKEGELLTSDKPEENIPDQLISIVDKITEIEKLKESRAEFNNFLISAEKINKDIEERKQMVIEIEQKIRTLKTNLEYHEVSIKEAKATKKSFVSPPEITEEEIDTAIKNLGKVEITNQKIKHKEEYRKTKLEVERLSTLSDEYSNKIEALKNKKKNEIVNAKYPLVGLSVDEEGVIFENKPFDQLSTGEQIKASVAIAMELNPKLKTILIKEGSLLDKKNLNMIMDAAKEKDYQIWIEKVDDSQSAGIYIEDGKIIQQEENKKDEILF